MSRLLTVNVGSSSAKLALFETEADTLVARERVSVAPAEVEPAIEARLAAVDAVGHRVVFGGLGELAPARVDPRRLADLQALTAFAPLHQPACLAPIAGLLRRHPGLPQWACFDSAFHRTMPAVAQRYGLPHELQALGARRWGFHGLSYEHAAARMQVLAPAARRVVVAHLGSGASLCALLEGRSIATTMGFSTLGGLLMATRPGELDPGLVLWLQRSQGLSLDDLEQLLYHRSGLLGVSGSSGDLRLLLDSEAPAAREAVALYLHRITLEVGAMAAALGGVDALVFTGGVGEHAAAIRAAVVERCRWLGAVLDPAANAGAHGETMIGAPSSAQSIWVLPADEERVIAGHVLRALTTR